MLPGVEGILEYKLQSVGRKFLGETMSEASLHCVHAHFRHSVLQLSKFLVNCGVAFFTHVS